MRDILLIAVTLFCSIAAIRWPVVGMLAFVAFSLTGVHGMTWTIARAINHSQFIAVGTILGFLLWNEPKRLPRERETFLMVALWLMFGVSTVFAMEPERAFAAFEIVSKVLAMVVLSMMLINNEQRLHALLRVIALSLGFWGLRGGQFFLRSGGEGMVSGPVDNFLASNNSIGLALVMNVPILFYLMKMETRPWLRWIMGAMLMLSYPAIIGTFSRGAWIGLAVVTVMLAMKGRRRWLALGGLATLLITSSWWAPQLFSPRVADRYESLVNYEEDSSAQGRLLSMEFCVRVAAARPLFGAGFRYYSPEAYRDYFPEFLELFPGKVWSCHSTWLSVLSEHGVVSFLVWVGLLISCFVSMRRIRKHAMHRSDGARMVRWADMVQASLVGFIVTGTFVDFGYFDLYYQLIAAVVIMKGIIRRQAMASSVPVPPESRQALSGGPLRRGRRVMSRTGEDDAGFISST